MRILVVDDDNTILELMVLMLQTTGQHHVHTANCAAAALEALKMAAMPYDALFFDIQMPQMTGIELCARIRLMPEHKNTPVIILTAMQSQEYHQRAFAAGASDYMTKPVDMDELRNLIIALEGNEPVSNPAQNQNSKNA